MDDDLKTPLQWQRPPGWAKLGVPASARGSVLQFVLQRFSHVPQAVWAARFAQQLVHDGDGHVLQAEDAVERVQHIVYPRHPPQETVIPFDVEVLFQDADILVVDKPHFLPVVPSGNYVAQTVLSRMQQQLGLMQLAPLHRLDKDTAGLVMLSVNPATRDRYHALFRDHAICKRYEAVAPADVRFATQVRHASRLEPGGARFFTMHEVDGAANSETLVQLLELRGAWGLYQLQPISGKKHQLRVHMAALGLPLRNDPFYPEITDPPEGDFSRPLQLLARSLEWIDPISGQRRYCESRRNLQWPVAAV
ncbi:pseudouridine synthase [Lampropedia aestuarii]|uniref:pseudouridine synthase n=1 Tax=Lampropedia aestuarii TaxID=2562762 RepID=UPI00246874C3|nr:pseudouridine synthase [Lampropedia aestuarii]MDH5857641.1 pseudouridine synthase [Lampropedia aestuarii]